MLLQGTTFCKQATNRSTEPGTIDDNSPALEHRNCYPVNSCYRTTDQFIKSEVHDDNIKVGQSETLGMWHVC